MMLYACNLRLPVQHLFSEPSVVQKSPGPPEMPDSEKAATHLRDLGGVFSILWGWIKIPILVMADIADIAVENGYRNS